MNLCSRDAGNLQQLSERLNYLHDKAKLRSDTKERAINQLIDSDIEIFHSLMDRQAVLYIWCKSETGHENLRSLCESKSIVDVIGYLTKNNSSAPEPIGSRMIDVNIDQFKKSIGKFWYKCPYIDTRVNNRDSDVFLIPPLLIFFLVPSIQIPSAVSAAYPHYLNLNLEPNLPDNWLQVYFRLQF